MVLVIGLDHLVELVLSSLNRIGLVLSYAVSIKCGLQLILKCNMWMMFSILYSRMMVSVNSICECH